jgi:hypothetical protein
MNYTLPDGTVIDLESIYEVSEIKDYGSDEKTIDEFTLSFTVRFRNEQSLKISRNYHYNDWFDIKKELEQTRQDIIEQWDKLRHKQP